MQIEPFRLERYFAKYEFNAPYLLSSSDCESITIKELLDMQPGSAEEFMQQKLGYTESEGAPLLREQIAGLYSQIEPADILVHTGAEEAIFNFMNVSLNPGEPAALLKVANDPQAVTCWSMHALSPAPGYVGTLVVKSRSCELKFWQYLIQGDIHGKRIW